jgi:hypothetical protein
LYLHSYRTINGKNYPVIPEQDKTFTERGFPGFSEKCADEAWRREQLPVVTVSSECARYSPDVPISI